MTNLKSTIYLPSIESIQEVLQFIEVKGVFGSYKPASLDGVLEYWVLAIWDNDKIGLDCKGENI